MQCLDTKKKKKEQTKETERIESAIYKMKPRNRKHWMGVERKRLQQSL